MRDPRGPNRLANLLLFLALPAILIGYLFISRFGFDSEAVLRAFGVAFDRILEGFRILATWVQGRLSDLIWIAAPFLVGALAYATKLSLSPTSRGSASGAGILAFFSFWAILTQMSAASQSCVMAICGIAAIGSVLSRKTRPMVGIAAMLAVVGLTVIGLSASA